MADKHHNHHRNKEEHQDEFTSGKHSVKRKQTERKLRKKRKKVNHLKTFLSSLLLILLVIGGYEFFKLPQWYLPQDTFSNIDSGRVEITNNKIVPTYVLQNELKDLEVSKLPIFMTSVTPIKKELYQIPMMKKVYVRRYGFPARIQIIVRERVPIAIIKTDISEKQPLAFYTTDGVLVTNKRYMNIADIEPKLLKILTSSKNLQKDIPFGKYQEIEKIVQSVETYSNEKVEYIDIRKPNDVYVKIQTTSIRLGTLDNTVYERIKRIYTILPQISEVNNTIKYIDLSWDRVNYLKLQKTK